MQRKSQGQRSAVLPIKIQFQDEPSAESNTQERNETEQAISKKGSLIRLAQKTELISKRAKSKEQVTKNILHQNEQVGDQRFFDSGLKVTLNIDKPVKSQERLKVPELKQKRKQKSLISLLKMKDISNQEDLGQEIKVVPNVPSKSFQQASSSAQIVLRTESEIKSNRQLKDALPLYRVPLEILNKKTFMLRPIPSGLTLQCTIRRQSSSLFSRSSPQYSLHVSQNFQLLVMAKRLSACCGSTYSVSLDSQHYNPSDQSCICQVKGNFWGSTFKIEDVSNKDVTKQIGMVKYVGFCCKSGPREMAADIVNMNEKIEDIFSRSKKLNLQNNVFQLVSKKPRYDEVRKVFVMKFNNRAKMADVKNFILVKKDSVQKNVLLFGRCNKETFSLDISYPLNPIQGFAIALTSLDSKLISQ